VSDHDQFRELIEGFALGAMDDQECAPLRAHLATGCAECTKALAEARWVASQLAYLAPPAEPSEMLKARLLRTVRAEATTAKSTASSRGSVPYWLWAGAAALLIVTLYSTWNARRLQMEIQAVNERAAAEIQQRQQLQQQLDAAKHQAHILMDPTSKKFPMWPHDTEMPRLEATWHPKMGIFVTGEKIPMPGSHRVLQLWLIPKAPGSKPMPSRTFWPDAQGKVVVMVDDPPEVMAETKALAVTEEPAGGSAQPTSTPMWVGGVS
jgi:anti-sigma-K factor RskA